jgi:hypothetical protein
MNNISKIKLDHAKSSYDNINRKIKEMELYIKSHNLEDEDDNEDNKEENNDDNDVDKEKEVEKEKKDDEENDEEGDEDEDKAIGKETPQPASETSAAPASATPIKETPAAETTATPSPKALTPAPASDADKPPPPSPKALTPAPETTAVLEATEELPYKFEPITIKDMGSPIKATYASPLLPRHVPLEK